MLCLAERHSSDDAFCKHSENHYPLKSGAAIPTGRMRIAAMTIDEQADKSALSQTRIRCLAAARYGD